MGDPPINPKILGQARVDYSLFVSLWADMSMDLCGLRDEKFTPASDGARVFAPIQKSSYFMSFYCVSPNL